VENLATGRLGKLMPNGVLGTPRRTFVVGLIAVILAAFLLLVYLRSYRNSVKSTSAPVQALVAKRYIPKGTAGRTIARNGLFEATVISQASLKEGAITDASALRDQVALAEIFPGQQLTIADFGVTATSTALSGVLQGRWRALAVTLDAQHGLSPLVQTNDRVDVYTHSGGVVGLLKPNVLVLQAPNQVATGTTAPVTTDYVLKVPVRDAPRFVWASANTEISFVLRGQKRPGRTPQKFVTSANIYARGR
jgi:Flp pilus assembly protein CpaB